MKIKVNARELRRAVSLYQSFREKRPKKLKVINVEIPRVAVVIGHLEYVGYKTTHGKKSEIYQHDFAPGSRPLLCVSSDGKQLLLLGGRYRFTRRGIVDRDHKGREIESDSHGSVLDS